MVYLVRGIHVKWLNVFLDFRNALIQWLLKYKYSNLYKKHILILYYLWQALHLLKNEDFLSSDILDLLDFF